MYLYGKSMCAEVVENKGQGDTLIVAPRQVEGQGDTLIVAPRQVVQLDQKTQEE